MMELVSTWTELEVSQTSECCQPETRWQCPPIALFNSSMSLVAIVAALEYTILQPVRRGKGRLGLPASPESYRH